MKTASVGSVQRTWLEQLSVYKGRKQEFASNRRTLYSLRRSYISFQVFEGTDAYQFAKTCSPSVAMIEKHDVALLRTVLRQPRSMPLSRHPLPTLA